MECFPWPKNINYVLAFLKVPNLTVQSGTFEITPGALCSVSCSPIQEWHCYSEARPKEDHEGGQGLARFVNAESAGLIQPWEENLIALFSHLTEYSKDARELDSSLSTGWQDKRQQTLLCGKFQLDKWKIHCEGVIKHWYMLSRDIAETPLLETLEIWLDKVLRNLP